MTEILTCKYVNKVIYGTVTLDSDDKEEFIRQYRSAIEATKNITGIVYVFICKKPVPRLKGDSCILYIGETKHDLWSRYSAKDDTESYWHVYRHILQDYGPISINVYVTTDHKSTEKEFLGQYYLKHKELPPINERS